MNNRLQKWGTLCLLLFVACIARAQGDVTALWDFQNLNPASLEGVKIEKSTGEVPSTVDGVSLYVDATAGKFSVRAPGNKDVQVNEGTIMRVPVKSTKDIVTVTAHPDYSSFTIGGVAATGSVAEHKATTAEAAQGYSEIVATANCYLYSIKVVFVSPIQEKLIYSTDFSEYARIEPATEEKVVESTTTKFSHETFNLSVYNTDVAGDATTAKNFDTSKFDMTKVKGVLSAVKNGGSYILTSPLASVTKVRFVHGVTGSKRGWSLWAKGDGDADWVQITTSYADNPRNWCEVTADVNRTNCQLKFTNIADNQYAYLFQLDISGNVDMSKTPALGSFKFNGQTYQAADIFNETSEGLMEATIEVASKDKFPSLDNPLTDITFENGQAEGDVAYEMVGETATATIKVVANGQTVTYKATFVRKPFFTLTYMNTDGTVLDNSQKVEKDETIATLRSDEGVTVGDGQKFRGWFVESDGGRKFATTDVVTSDLTLYAVATDVETMSDNARYVFDLTDPYFYDEDHEAFNSKGSGAFHDKQHGWAFGNGDKIDLLVGGHAYVIFGLCKYSSGTATLTDADGQTVASIDMKAQNDGEKFTLKYDGAPTTLTLTFPATAYMHGITVQNVTGAPIEKNDQGYYVVRAGDAGHLLTTLDIANANASQGERTFIFVPDGTYDLGKTVLTPISGSNISLVGQSRDKTIIVNAPDVKNEGIGTTATLFVTGNNTYFQDLTLKNDLDYYNSGSAGRAVCLQDKGTHTICKNVNMLSYQDTYYSNSNSGQYYFEDSEIHGTVDFLCGNGDVYYNRCTFVVEPRSKDGKGECTIAAPQTNGNKWGYVMNGCTIDNKAESFNFGRAWGGQPKLAYLNTTLLQPEMIRAERFRPDGMNNVADKFVEFNSVDKDGNVVSPASNVVKFTQGKDVKEYETILTAEQAAEYALDKVFTDWQPAAQAAQATMGQLKADGNTLTWDAVDGASTYAVFFKGAFVGMTSTTSYTFGEGTAADYTVRAANAMGGFGPAAGTTSGIEGVEAGNGGDVASTLYYNVQGARVSKAFSGMAIRVDMMKDGRKVVTKVVK